METIDELLQSLAALAHAAPGPMARGVLAMAARALGRAATPKCPWRGEVVEHGTCACGSGDVFLCNAPAMAAPDGAPGKARRRDCQKCSVPRDL